MIEQRCRRVQFVILWALSVCIPMMADGPTTFATYKPIPMRSTSAMPLATNGMEVGWDKPALRVTVRTTAWHSSSAITSPMSTKSMPTLTSGVPHHR